MLSNSIPSILEDLKRTKKAIVAVGCSFVQGAELSPLGLENANSYKNERTFVNQLCEVLFNKQYTPINFGQEAAGNFAAISRLFLYNIPWSSLDEIIVIFMPTGMQRFDIIKDDNSSKVGNEFKTLWPFVNSSKPDSMDTFSKFYESTTYSEKFEVLNCCLNFQFLNSWVKQHNARLLTFPAFSKEYNREYFLKRLQSSIHRDEQQKIVYKQTINSVDYNADYLVDQVPWNSFIKVDDCTNFFELCYKNDSMYNPKLNMLQVITSNSLANNKWIMPKGHPSSLGHTLLAKRLFEIITAV